MDLRSTRRGKPSSTNALPKLELTTAGPASASGRLVLLLFQTGLRKNWPGSEDEKAVLVRKVNQPPVVVAPPGIAWQPWRAGKELSVNEAAESVCNLCPQASAGPS